MPVKNTKNIYKHLPYVPLWNVPLLYISLSPPLAIQPRRKPEYKTNIIKLHQAVVVLPRRAMLQKILYNTKLGKFTSRSLYPITSP